MMSQPDPCRAVVFIDGQNLTKSAERAFGHKHPLFDPFKLGAFVCHQRACRLEDILFYSGIPPIDREPFWHHFWSKKKTQMQRRGVVCKTRPVNYRVHVEKLDDGTFNRRTIAEEKGIDVSIAVDLISLAYQNKYDMAIVFSQDQDLCPAVEEVKRIAKSQSRWIKVVSAFPVSDRSENRLGIRDTDWFQIEELEYNQCLDHYDYASRAAEDARKARR
jgi:uncharacterized LabA/DUF88 family protein